MTLVVTRLFLLVSLVVGSVVSLAHGTAGDQIFTVGIVGDSLSWQAETSIESVLSHSGYLARISVNPGHALSSSWAQGRLTTDLRDSRIGIIVIETASNDSFDLARSAISVDQYSNLLKGLLRAAGGRCVVVVNAKVNVTPFYYRPQDALAVNRTISELALANPNERIVDWNEEAQSHRSWFRVDLLHFTSDLPIAGSARNSPPSLSQSAGDRAFALAIVHGVQSCVGTTQPTLRDGSHVGADPLAGRPGVARLGD